MFPSSPLEDRCRSPEATKKAVLKGSTWETLIDKDGSDSDDGGPDAGGQAPAVDDNASSQATGRKRRRALLRAPTDADNVEVFSNPTHPLLVKEFLHEFKSTWVLRATPEQGITLTAALSSDVRAPVLAFARNAAHKELVEQNVEKQLTNALVESRPSAAQPKVKQQTLVDLWERVRACEKTKQLKEADFQSSSSGADSDEEEEKDQEDEETKKEEADRKKTPKKNKVPKKKETKPKTQTPTKEKKPTKKEKKPAAKEPPINKTKEGILGELLKAAS